MWSVKVHRPPSDRTARTVNWRASPDSLEDAEWWLSQLLFPAMSGEHPDQRQSPRLHVASAGFVRCIRLFYGCSLRYVRLAHKLDRS